MLTGTAGAGGMALVALLVCVTACSQPELADQPSFRPLDAAPGWPQDQSARHPPAGTVARGAIEQPSAMPDPLTRSLLERGQKRFDVFCTPCHDRLGTGRGMVVRHGFPAPPSFHSPALRRLTLRRIYEVITAGYGRMYAYGDRVPPADRWAIAAYIQALQLSQRVPFDSLTPAQRARLRKEPAG